MRKGAQQHTSVISEKMVHWQAQWRWQTFYQLEVDSLLDWDRVSAENFDDWLYFIVHFGSFIHFFASFLWPWQLHWEQHINSLTCLPMSSVGLRALPKDTAAVTSVHLPLPDLSCQAADLPVTLQACWMQTEQIQQLFKMYTSNTSLVYCTVSVLYNWHT